MVNGLQARSSDYALFYNLCFLKQRIIMGLHLTILHHEHTKI
jgi:hypothetical protein